MVNQDFSYINDIYAELATSEEARFPSNFGPPSTCTLRRKNTERSRESANELLVPDPDASDRTVPFLCPHGAVETLADGRIKCGVCLAEGSSPEEIYLHFLRSLRDVAKHTAFYLTKLYGVSDGSEFKLFGHDFGDCVSQCFTLLLSPKNLARILHAHEPVAMAHIIARRRLLNFLSRDKDRQKIDYVGGTTPDGEGSVVAQGDDAESNDKLSELAAMRTDARHNGSPVLAYGPNAGGPNDFVFPGFELLWTRENMDRLANLMNEGFEKLDKNIPLRVPFKVSTAIKLKHGFYAGVEPYTWYQLRRWCSARRNQTTNQVRYEVERGEGCVRDFIVKTVLASLNEEGG